MFVILVSVTKGQNEKEHLARKKTATETWLFTLQKQHKKVFVIYAIVNPTIPIKKFEIAVIPLNSLLSYIKLYCNLLRDIFQSGSVVHWNAPAKVHRGFPCTHWNCVNGNLKSPTVKTVEKALGVRPALGFAHSFDPPDPWVWLLFAGLFSVVEHPAFWSVTKTELHTIDVILVCKSLSSNGLQDTSIPAAPVLPGH